MIPLRLYDRSRTPSSWTEIIRPGQFVTFAKTFDTGAPCDAHGRSFAMMEDASCLVFDSLDEAETFCREQVNRATNVRFEIFDSAGRAQPSSRSRRAVRFSRWRPCHTSGTRPTWR